MPQFALTLALTVEADTLSAAYEVGVGAAEHLADTFNDDGSLSPVVGVNVRPEGAPDPAEVWAAHYDVRNGGSGVNIYTTQAAAIDAVISSCAEELAGGSNAREDAPTEDEARQQLRDEGHFSIEWREDYYRVTCEQVNGAQADPCRTAALALVRKLQGMPGIHPSHYAELAGLLGVA